MSKSKDTLENQIAIVGMSCIFPGAPDLKTFWQNISEGKESLADLPESRLPKIYYDPDSQDPDRVYCRRGGFIDPHAGFDPVPFGITPTMARDGEPDQFLALKVAHRAMIDAGYADIKARKAGVIIGKGSYQNAAGQRYNQRMRAGGQLVTGLKKLLPDLDDKTAKLVRQLVQKELGAYRAENTIALVPSFTAAWVANRMDFHGPSYTVDAACSSALLAVKNACEYLRSGICDLMIAGGMHIFLDIAFWSVFCQLKIMSPTHRIRPLSKNADGLLVGEGVGLLVLKRLKDAMADRDRIYAVIRGVGVSSDGRATSIMKPLMEGQLRAISDAWSQTDLDRSQLDLIEAHSPGTPVGDTIELTTLGNFFGGPRRDAGPAVIGSVKGNIGHTMPAAGAAGLIKAALAVHHGVLPSTLACEEPHPLLASTPFRTLAEFIPWQKPPCERIAGVNAFGFGGTNAHVLLQGIDPRRPSTSRATSGVFDRYTPKPRIQEILVLEGKDPADLLSQLDHAAHGNGAGTDRSCRLVVLGPDSERLKKARRIVEQGSSWYGRYGIFFSTKGLLSQGGRIAFMYPGVEAEFDPDIEETASYFGLDFPEFLANLKSSEEQFQLDKFDLEARGVGIVLMSKIITSAMKKIGVTADVMFGHSIGEWSGLIAAGVINESVVGELLGSVKADDLKLPDIDFGLVGCGYAAAERAIAGLADITVSHDNCLHQCILCGKHESMSAAFERLGREHVICKTLPFKSGFHSPLFQDYLGHVQKHIDKLDMQKAHTPMWSASSCAPFPDESLKIKALMSEQLVSAVRFRPLVLKLYKENVRAFIQIGSGTLPSFVDDILKTNEHVAVATNANRFQGMGRIIQAALALYVEGAEVDLAKLPLHKVPLGMGEIMLDLGTDFLKFNDEAWDALAGTCGVKTSPQNASKAYESGADGLADVGAHHPYLAQLFHENMSELRNVQHNIISAFEREAGAWQDAGLGVASAENRGAEASETACVREGRWTKPFSVVEYPVLVDHSFFPQPEGWENLNDKMPVAPMTMLLQVMMEEAQKMVVGRIPIGLEDIRATKWMKVDPPVEANIISRVISVDRVEIAIEGYVQSTVIFAQRYPEPPAVNDTPLPGQKPMQVSAQSMYDDYMFHGPGYQGAVKLDLTGDDSISGTIEMKEAIGCLLDTAGQFFGLWVILNSKIPCMPFPLYIKRVAFFGPLPELGDRLECTCRNIKHGISADVSGDFELTAGGRVWCVIEGWTDYVFVEDDLTNTMLRDPGRKIVTDIDANQISWVGDRWPEQSHRERMTNRYMSQKERAQFKVLDQRGQTERLLKTLVAKDLLRSFFWSHGKTTVFPVEIGLDFDDENRPVWSTTFESTYVPTLAVAYRDKTAVAVLGENGAGIAIEIEPIVAGQQPKDMDLGSLKEGLMFTQLPMEEWAARLKAARAVVLKTLPHEQQSTEFLLQQVDGCRFMLSGVWINTSSRLGFAVAWT